MLVPMLRLFVTDDNEADLLLLCEALTENDLEFEIIAAAI